MTIGHFFHDFFNFQSAKILRYFYLTEKEHVHIVIQFSQVGRHKRTIRHLKVDKFRHSSKGMNCTKTS